MISYLLTGRNPRVTGRQNVFNQLFQHLYPSGTFDELLSESFNIVSLGSAPKWMIALNIQGVCLRYASEDAGVRSGTTTDERLRAD